MKNIDQNNVENAANNYLDTIEPAELMCGDYEGWQMLEAFKAGAEWLASQGYSFNSVVYGKEGECLAGGHSVPEGYFEKGDEIVVQIRKK